MSIMIHDLQACTHFEMLLPHQHHDILALLFVPLSMTMAVRFPTPPPPPLPHTDGASLYNVRHEMRP